MMTVTRLFVLLYLIARTKNFLNNYFNKKLSRLQC